MTLMLLLLVLIFSVFLAEVLSHWEWVITWTQAPKPAVLRRGLYRAGAEMGQRGWMDCVAGLNDSRTKLTSSSQPAIWGVGKEPCVKRSRAYQHVFLLVLQFFNQMQEELKQLDIKCEC